MISWNFNALMTIKDDACSLSYSMIKPLYSGGRLPENINAVFLTVCQNSVASDLIKPLYSGSTLLIYIYIYIYKHTSAVKQKLIVNYYILFLSYNPKLVKKIKDDLSRLVSQSKHILNA